LQHLFSLSPAARLRLCLLLVTFLGLLNPPAAYTLHLSLESKEPCYLFSRTSIVFLGTAALYRVCSTGLTSRVCVSLSPARTQLLCKTHFHIVSHFSVSLFFLASSTPKHAHSLAFSLLLPLSSFRVRAPLHSRWPSLNLSCHPVSDYTSVLFCLSLSLARFPRSFSEFDCFPRCSESDDLSDRSNSFIVSQTLIFDRTFPSLSPSFPPSPSLSRSLQVVYLAHFKL